MPVAQTKPSLLDRISAAFLKRSVVLGCVFAIITICLIAGSYVQTAVNQLQNTHQSFNDRQLRNGYIALSDVQRLVLILQDAYGRRQMSAKAMEDFQSATDFLYVRTDTFQRVQEKADPMASADAAIAALRKVQMLADEAILTGFQDLAYLSSEMTLCAQDARRALVRYLDEMRQMQDQLLAKQSAAVKNQRNVIWVTLLGLSVLGIASIIILRREVLAKLARLEAEARVHHLAFFDSLTGLPNRVQFQDQLGHMLSKETELGLLLVDLDGFKHVNDTHGHAAGDAILRHVAQVLERVVEEQNGLAARLGGDEFAIIMPTVDLDILAATARSAIQAIDKPISFEGETLQVAASIGVATDMQRDSDGLVRAADFALYASKSGGRGQLTIYDEELEHQFVERRDMIEELPEAIASGGIEFFLQPKVDLETQQVFGFEALARWRRNGVIIPPNDFISIAEESGLIADLDCRLLQDATREVAAFNQRNNTQFSISVNFSTMHFSSARLAEIVRSALEASQLQPELLTIEITETAEMHDWGRAEEIIGLIHNIGARISIDDFGAGFSSLSYLRKTVADEIKIDRSLVTDIENSDSSRFLLDAVIDIARNLDMDVIVEGVETRAQVDLLRAMGATRAQGYYFGMPLPWKEAMTAAMARQVETAQKFAS